MDYKNKYLKYKKKYLDLKEQLKGGAEYDYEVLPIPIFNLFVITHIIHIYFK